MDLEDSTIVPNGDLVRFEAKLVYPDPKAPESRLLAYTSSGYVLLDISDTYIKEVKQMGGRLVTGYVVQKEPIPLIMVQEWTPKPNIHLPPALPISEAEWREGPPFRVTVTGFVVRVEERPNEIEILVERNGEHILLRNSALADKTGRVTARGAEISIAGVCWPNRTVDRMGPMLFSGNKWDVRIVKPGSPAVEVLPEEIQPGDGRLVRLPGWFLERDSRGNLLFRSNDDVILTVAPLPHASPKPGKAYLVDGWVSKVDASTINVKPFALRRANTPSKAFRPRPMSDESTRGDFVTVDGKVTYIHPNIDGRMHLQIETTAKGVQPIQVSVPRKLAEKLTETIGIDDRIIISGLMEESSDDVNRIVLTDLDDIEVAANPPRSWFLLLITLVVLGTLLSLAVCLALRVRARTQDLSLSRATLSGIQNSIPEAILACQADGTVFSFNDRSREWFGLDGKERGLRETDVLARIRGILPETCHADWDNALANARDPAANFVEFPHSLTSAETSLPKHLECCRVPLQGDTLGEPGTLWIFRDISARKELEQSLQQAQKLEAVGQLTGGIAHDFNNLLTGIIGNLSLLEMDVQETAQREMIDDAQASADRARELVAQMLGYARKSRLNPLPTSLNALSADLYNLLRRSLPAGITIEFHLQENLPITMIDRKKVEQVLMNLILNAVDATEGQGKIMLESGQDDQGQIFIEIADNGPGIPPAIQEKMFDPFFTTKEQGKGTGLGLSVALGIVEQHGGRITCQSTPETGTRFRVAFPMATNQDVKHEPDVASLHANGSVDIKRQPMATTVLVIDDEPSVLAITRNMLKRLGCKPICVPNGEEAIRALEKEPGLIDVVLSDNAMPIMNGVETFRWVARECPALPFIVASGYLVDLEEYADVADGRRPDHFIAKPFEIRRLDAAIRTVTSEPTSN